MIFLGSEEWSESTQGDELRLGPSGAHEWQRILELRAALASARKEVNPTGLHLGHRHHRMRELHSDTAGATLRLGGPHGTRRGLSQL
jgi:hypothetical protein